MAAAGQFLLIVFLGGAGGDKGDRLGFNGHIAVAFHNKGHVGEGGVVVHEAVCRETHVGGACMEAFRMGAGPSCQAEVAFLVQAGGDADHLIAVGHVGVAIVHVGVAVALQGHNHFHSRFGHGQLAGQLGNGVVISLGVVVQGVGVGVVAAAHSRLAAGNSVGGTFAIRKAIAGDGDLVVGQGRTVVHLGIVCTLQSYCTLGDGQLTIHHHEFHIGEVVAGVGEVGSLHVHVVGIRIRAGHGVRAGEGEVSGGIQGVGNGHVIAGHGMGFAVVLHGVAVLGDGDSHFVGNGGDGQLAGFRGDVVVGFQGVNMQIVGEDVVALAYVQLAAGNGGVHTLILGEAAAGDGHGVVFQCLAIVHLFSGGALQGHVPLFDGQGAVGDQEGHIGEVAADVGELIFLQTHGVGVRIRAGYGVRAGEGEVSFLIQVVVDADRIAGHFVLIAIVGQGRGVAGDGHGHFIGDGGDLQGSIVVGDGVVVIHVVPCCIQDHSIGNLVFHFAHIGDGACDGDAVQLVPVSQPLVADAVGAVSLAVIDPFAVAGVDGQRPGIHRQFAVGDHESHIGEGGVVVHEAGAGEPHGVAAHVGAFRIGVDPSCQAEVIGGVQGGSLTAQGDGIHGVAVDRVGGAVIGYGVGIAMEGDHHSRCRFGHGQLAGFRGDGVVVCLGVAVQGVGEGVVAGADIRLAAGNVVGCTFAIRKAHAANGNVAVGQGGAVIGLGGRAAGQGHIPLENGNETFHRAGHDVLAGLVYLVFRQGRHNAGFTCIRAGSVHGHHIGEVCFVFGAVVPGHGHFLTVVVGLGTVCHDLGILIIVESDLVGAGGDGDILGIRGYGGVAIDGDGGFRNHITEGLAGDHLIRRHGGGGVVPHIVDGVAQVRPLGVGDGDRLVLCGHGAGDHSRAGHIAVNGRRGHGISPAVGHVFGVGFFCLGAILVNIVHGEGEDILLIVNVDDVLALIHLNGQGQVFRRVQHVAGGALIGVGCYLRAKVCRAGCLKILLLHAVQIVLHIVGAAIGGVVEGDFLVVCIQGEGLGFRLHHGVAGDRLCRLGDGGVEGLVFNYLILCNGLGGALLVVVHRVAHIRVGSPDGIQHVFAIAVQAGFCACSKGGAFAVGTGVPADEVVAGFRRDANCRIAQHGDLAVVQHSAGGVVAAVTAVGLVGYGHGAVGIHVHGGQGHVVVQGQVGAGVVVVGAVRPVGEHLARGGGEGAVGHTGGSIGGVGVGVGHVCARALAGGVGQGVGLTHEDGFDGFAFVQGLMFVNQVAFIIHPLQEGITFFLNPGVGTLVDIRVSNGGAHCHGRRAGELVAFHLDGDAHFQLRLLPVGIQGLVAGRHGVSCEVKGCGAFRNVGRVYFIPALEHSIFGEAVGAGRGCAVAAQGCAVLHGLGRFRAVVVQNQVVAVTEVIQRQFIVAKVFAAAVESRNTCRIPGKALNFMVFFIIGCIVKVGINRFQQVKVGSAGRPGTRGNRCANLLYIIGNGLFGLTGLSIKGERCIKAGHTIQRLQSIAVLAFIRALPRTTIISGVEGCFVELAGDFLIVLSGNGCNGASPATLLERQRIGVPLIVHVQHGGAVCRHGDGIGLFEGEVAAVTYGIRQCAGGCVQGQLRAGCRSLGNSYQRRILLIVCILAPVDHGISYVAGGPLRRQHHAGGGGEAARHGGAAGILPAGEGVAGAGGGRQGIQVQGLTLLHVLAGHLAAAGRVEGHPVSGHGHRGHIGIPGNHRVSGEGGGGVLDDPAGHLGILGFIVVRQADLVAIVSSCLLGGVHIAILAEEVHIVHVGELGVHGDFGGGRIAGNHAEGQLRIAHVPAIELLAVRGRGGGGAGDAFALGLVHDLGADRFAIHSEVEGHVNVRVRFNRREGDEGAGRSADVNDFCQGSHWHAADDHHDRRQPRQCSPHGVFHNSILHLPMV